MRTKQGKEVHDVDGVVYKKYKGFKPNKAQLSILKRIEGINNDKTD